MNTQKNVNQRLAKLYTKQVAEKQELSSEKVELAVDPAKLIQDFKDQSSKLANADNGLRDAQTIAINVRRALEKIESDIDSTIKEIASVLGSEAAKIISKSEISALNKQKNNLETARSQARGRLSRAEAINDAVKRVLNR